MKEVVNGKLNERDLDELRKANLVLGSTENLNMYNEAPYFSIEKFYCEGKICGFAVIFLGHNGLESTDASLEELVYWLDDSNALYEFLRTVTDRKDFPIETESIYFDSKKFADLTPLLEDTGFSSKRIRG